MNSCYHTDKFDINESDRSEIYARKYDNCTYGLGFDWIWGMASNETTFMNSFKMKLSIIIGVTHMTLGIILKGFNCLHFGAFCDFIFEFLPQLLFMTCTFGYMCFCIIIKWMTNWDNRQPPAIIQLFIEFVQQPQDPLYGDPEGLQQMKVQQFLASIALICIPLMLFVKPCYEKLKMSRAKKIDDLITDKQANGHAKQKFIAMSDVVIPPGNNDAEMMQDRYKIPEPQAKKAHEKHNPFDEDSFDIEGTGDDHKAHEEFGEIMIHQMIETIEFVLGCVSNTASYLRLWALS